ncbi:MAG: hypothetical protein KAR44_01090 [Candidatus Aegiribacteria sp.]|nr:hypothetical protein [Candidatus Aegiribacteria sp.]
MMILFLILLQYPTPAELADMAAESFLNGQYTEASEIWNELLTRMPHRSRIAYNLAASMFLMDSPAAADSTLTLVSGDVDADTLACAVALTDLALSIQMEDYSGVENTVDILIENISDGLSPECERKGLEAGLNWLSNHDPPDDQNEDQQDQNEDQQDQNEDQQDQNEDQQDQNEDQQDQNEDQQDQNEDQQDQQDQNEEQPQPPPEIDEMTPEQAQAILDLIEENQQPQDSTGKVKTGLPSGPVW